MSNHLQGLHERLYDASSIAVLLDMSERQIDDDAPPAVLPTMPVSRLCEQKGVYNDTKPQLQQESGDSRDKVEVDSKVKPAKVKTSGSGPGSRRRRSSKLNKVKSVRVWYCASKRIHQPELDFSRPGKY